MKKILTLAILGVVGLAGAARAEANDGHRSREFRHPAEHRDTCRPNRVWIAPRYETRIVGEECGRPVTRVVLLAPGYWSVGPACR
ncbi:MAG TPA: hypothetical protein VKW04_16070 [Planctomycetota bacterium]|nr:hypothetical protein [Planctomycetota bacterium]